MLGRGLYRHWLLLLHKERLRIYEALALRFTSDFLENPIILVITLITVTVHHIFEQLSQIVIIRLLIKLKVPAIIKI
jgi:hypothetical protein